MVHINVGIVDYLAEALNAINLHDEVCGDVFDIALLYQRCIFNVELYSLKPPNYSLKSTILMLSMFY